VGESEPVSGPLLAYPGVSGREASSGDGPALLGVSAGEGAAVATFQASRRQSRAAPAVLGERGTVATSQPGTKHGQLEPAVRWLPPRGAEGTVTGERSSPHHSAVRQTEAAEDRATVVAFPPPQLDQRGIEGGNPRDGVHLLDQVTSGVVKATESSRLQELAQSHPSRVTVQLRPSELGTIQIAVECKEGQLRAHFHATDPAVHTWLAANASALRAHLADAGRPLHDLTFSTSAHQHTWRGWQQPFAPGEAAPLHLPSVAPQLEAVLERDVTHRLVDCLV